MFFRQYLSNPGVTGAIAPSSRFLARCIVDAAAIEPGKRVLELGPGNGAFTGEVVRALGGTGSYLGIDINPMFIASLQRRFTSLSFVAGDAATYDFSQYCKANGAFDAVVSGLPWAAFPQSLQVSILEQVLPQVTEQGTFVTFAYLGLHLKPAGRGFRRLLHSYFAQVSTTSTVWGNLPPAFVYIASRPRLGSRTEAS